MLRGMNDADGMELLRKEWRAVDAELPQHLRPEEINSESDPEKRWQLVMRSSIERRKIEARRNQAHRPRAIGPVDRAIRRMGERMPN